MSIKVAVAMSGGVDSSVAALILAQSGYEPVGISMQVWDYRKSGGCDSRKTCCSPDDFTDARLVAGALGIPYYVFDFEETFQREVIDRFVREYQSGLTPNPCVECNNKVKFRELRARAQFLGIDKVATGHYAVIKERQGALRLFRSKDKLKDQSYFLYGLKNSELANTIFPVGEMEKPAVRELAHQHNLRIHNKKESQDICFVSGTVQDFLVKIGGKKNGTLVDTEGKQLGTHEGIQNFTVGQRRSLGISGSSEPMYVTEIRADSNEVVIGTKDDLAREGFLVRELNFVSPDMQNIRAGDVFDCIVQVRHRHKGERVKVEIVERGAWQVVSASSSGLSDGDLLARVVFVDGWCPVSPGQAAVFYDVSNEEVLGGGKIFRAV